jgi:hypothetical protein
MLMNTSTLTTPLLVKNAQGNTLSTATGFWYRRQPDGELFLVTNWHVVTGRKPSAPNISETGAVPTSLHGMIHEEVGQGKSADPLIHEDRVVHFELPINDEDGERPRWFEHPTFLHRVDVVALRMGQIAHPSGKGLVLRAVGDPNFLDLNPFFSTRVTDDAFVLGYPWGLRGGGDALPIYKRGTIASEPTLSQAGLPRFLIDCRTASGMSGSPVLATRPATGQPLGVGRSPVFGRAGAFVGVYSGRLLPEDLGASAIVNDTIAQRARDEISEIGVVWRSEVIAAIVNNNRQGSKLSEIIGLQMGGE